MCSRNLKHVSLTYSIFIGCFSRVPSPLCSSFRVDYPSTSSVSVPLQRSCLHNYLIKSDP